MKWIREKKRWHERKEKKKRTLRRSTGLMKFLYTKDIQMGMDGEIER